MKPYLVGFGLVCFGMILGFIIAAICAAAGRTDGQGYQPDRGNLDPNNPPRGGSGNLN